LGDHIADVGHDILRGQLVKNLVDAVRSSLTTQKPWTITPTGAPESILPELMKRFEHAATKDRRGLIDAFTWSESLRLRAGLSGYKPRVHIWTNDRSLKAKEPDPELDRFLW